MRAGKPIATVLVAALTLAASSLIESEPAGEPSQVSSARLNPQWRTVLNGKAAFQVIKHCGPLDGTRDATWVPSAPDLDRLDRKLLPRLAADLKSAGSSRLPQEYYRQYAAADWQDKQIIYVNGFHQSQLQKLAASWKSNPITVRTKGTDFWCAIYIRNTAHFVAFQEKGRADRTVSFGS
jgi:hypothetical protein